ncbi:transketolase [Comamonas aquatica]|jgi:transketolase|uniref:Transketolase n=1 Tax=Comamonas aquatica TaxID=225991 RepID=A0AA35GHW5_9BURK|nr:transketolase [Comamonas aquatica]MDH0898297.1 transketolase [Comamonas aquatica]MDH1767677.1 transketolase [Comamonas aquatica]QTX20474.1 transketolase [Comamonas aquatica]CAB5661803.1 Transketolase 1 [Comamonas aquatica]CAC9691398.1 Transketolase 1 [Comamonas aquatica]
MANTPMMANAIRALAMDAVQQANSGHPGAPMGMADMAVALWSRHLQHNPANPLWANRDRFILSNGHGSMLIYALLHLSGYDLPLQELKNFRQLHSKTAGHPEVGITPGVETTTGPLGQGITNAVGFALAEKLLAAEFNQPKHAIVDHHTFVFMGDGCLMEGISHEAAALAGAWKLNKLIALWDDNGISIDGQVTPWFGDDTPARFEAYGWNVIRAVDGHNVDAVDAAIALAKKSKDKPTLICCKTSIGKGSPNRANTAKAHGEPLGADEIALTRAALGWTHAPFEIPAEVYADWDAKAAGQKAEAAWNKKFAAYAKAFPAQAAEFTRRMAGELPANFLQVAAQIASDAHDQAATVASRKASQLALEGLTAALPELLGGSADLTGSNLTNTKSTPAFRVDAKGAVVKTEAGQIGRHINYGVREFGMAAIMNGIALHGGFIPYAGTFLTFSDYSRNAIRMAALMKQRVVHVFTHDSIGLGEDGPTHQSIEHAASLRLIPGLDVWRPADTTETAVAWTVALSQKHKPTALLLSRQNLAYAPKSEDALDHIANGAYVLSEPKDVGLKGKAQAVIIATGSEVQLALAAQKQLAAQKIAVRVVSMPSTTTFDKQDVAYKTSVLPAGLPRIAVEMGVTDFWWKYGCAAVVGIDTYGESAPAPVLFKHFGFTAENVAATVIEAIQRNK